MRFDNWVGLIKLSTINLIYYANRIFKELILVFTMVWNFMLSFRECLIATIYKDESFRVMELFMVIPKLNDTGNW